MKSSPPDRSFAGFVRRALAAIESEVPWAHEGLSRALGDRTALLVVDGEPARVHASSPGGVAVAAQSGAADVVCTTTSRAILDLIRGRESLLDAVLSDRVELVGDAAALLSWLDALALFLHGAVRARAFEGLLGDFQRRPAAERERS